MASFRDDGTLCGCDDEDAEAALVQSADSDPEAHAMSDI
jgi:hypothetical protein